MKEQTNKLINDLIKTFELDERITILKNNKQQLLSNQEFMRKIEKLKSLDIYSNEYKGLKQELFKNPDFVQFKQLENEINLLIMKINQKLNSLIDKKGCNHESN